MTGAANVKKPLGVVGGKKARDLALNHIAKAGCKEAAEVEVRYTDERGNVWRDRVEGGKVNESRCIKNSASEIQRINDRSKELSGSRQGKYLSIPAEAWDRIFGGKKATA